MNSVLIISLLVLSHVISDFYFQNEQMSKDKEESKVTMLKHTFHFAIIGLALTIIFSCWRLSLIILLLSASHFIFDSLKVRLVKKYNQLPKLFYFIIDQLLHIIAILSVYPFIETVVINPWSSRIIAYLSVKYPLLENLTYSKLTYYILASAFFLFLTNGGTIITKLFLELPPYLANKQTNDGADPIAPSAMSSSQEAAATRPEIQVIEEASHGNENVEQKNQLYKYGEVIGVLERIIIFLLIISGHYEGITFVIAAKSIARFKQFSEDNFSDYYLVGTLASSLTAIIGAELFLMICKSFNIA
jgi:hypothetical protein